MRDYFAVSLQKARKKSMYRIGKHPNSHKRKAKVEESDPTPLKALRSVAKLYFETYLQKAWDESKHPRQKDGKFGVKTGVGTGFTQKDGSWRASDGSPADSATAARLKELRVPPGWRDVRLNPEKGAALVAVGRDAKGRNTAMYSEAHHEAQAVKKFERLKRFVAVRDKLVSQAVKDAAAGNEEAAAMLLIAKTGIRIGSTRDTGAKVQAYGATTLQTKHVKVEGSVTSFDFVGKKGVHIQLTSVDRDMARMLKTKLRGKKDGDTLFRTTDSKVRDYMQSRGGRGFMPKDFRTYVATSTALEAIKNLAPATGEKEFKKMRLAVAKRVSAQLGNTPAMALSSYIDPAVWHHIHPSRRSTP